MDIIFRPEAEMEILDSRTWYELRSAGLGFEFARAVEVAIETASRMPHGFEKIDGEFRQILLSRFSIFNYLPFIRK